MTQRNKIALITGGSRGLGKDMALSLAKKGVDVIITYNAKKEEANAVVTEIQHLGQKSAALQLDVSSTAGFDLFITEVTNLLTGTFETSNFDYLVNNAGIGYNVPFAETTEEQFDTLLNIQFRSVFFLTQKAAPLIADGGGIVNLSSGLTRFSLPGYSAYSAMKGAIETLTKYLAKELAPRRIRANVVAPGAIETDFGGGAVRDNASMNKYIAAQTALGRVGLPDDIGGVVAFLCSDDGKWVNAQRLEVSGGIYI